MVSTHMQYTLILTKVSEFLCLSKREWLFLIASFVVSCNRAALLLTLSPPASGWKPQDGQTFKVEFSRTDSPVVYAYWRKSQVKHSETFLSFIIFRPIQGNPFLFPIYFCCCVFYICLKRSSRFILLALNYNMPLFCCPSRFVNQIISLPVYSQHSHVYMHHKHHLSTQPAPITC